MHCSLMILLQFTIICVLEAIRFYCIHIWVILCNVCANVHLFPIHVGLEISCVGSIYTREIGKGHKSIPFLLFFRDLAVTHLSALHWKWSLKKPGVVSVVRKIKA